MCATPRLPMQPLITCVHRRHQHNVEQDGQLRLGNVVEFCGFQRRVYLTWQKAGGIPVDSADRAAASLGLHPIDIWPDYHDLIGANNG